MIELIKENPIVGVLKRLFWSFAVLPFLGPLFYGAFYRVPPKHRYGGASVNQDAFYGAD